MGACTKCPASAEAGEAAAVSFGVLAMIVLLIVLYNKYGMTLQQIIVRNFKAERSKSLFKVMPRVHCWTLLMVPPMAFNNRSLSGSTP
jgi:hypothetical protein